MRTQKEQNNLIVFLEGKIDSTNSPQVHKELEEVVAANPGMEPVLDAEGLSYISSAGLRVLLQLTKSLGKQITMRNVTPEVYEIMDITGFTDILNVRKKLRELSVEDCEIIGRGAIGTVYRIDDDTIVKVYEIPDCLPMIENEQKRAKQAFLYGIPTAISYDVVKVGDKYGSVFEMLKASTYNDLLVEHPEKTEEIVRQYALFIRKLHTIEVESGELPEAKEQFLGYLDELSSILPKELRERLSALFAAMPENLHVIHGDIQMKNVMLSAGEPMLIDMDTLSVGDPVFDLMGLYLAYIQFNEDEPTNTQYFLGLSEERCTAIWREILKTYFDGADTAALETAEKKIIAVSSVRFLYLIAVLGIGKPELNQIRVDHTVSRLNELVKELDSLTLTER
jgi:uncharacterized protein (TIGR02172 family)